MKNNHITWFGRYEGYLRTSARGVRDNNPSCIECASKLFDLMLPEGSVVAPMPSHIGCAVQMLSVANELHRRRPDVVVCDLLRCDPHSGSYAQKKYRITPSHIRMFITPEFHEYSGLRMFILDNVICTGVTASAALEVLPNSTVVALAMSSWR